MTDLEEKIYYAEKHYNEYCRMLENIELLKTSLERSIENERKTIRRYKKILEGK